MQLRDTYLNPVIPFFWSAVKTENHDLVTCLLGGGGGGEIAQN